MSALDTVKKEVIKCKHHDSLTGDVLMVDPTDLYDECTIHHALAGCTANALAW